MSILASHKVLSQTVLLYKVYQLLDVSDSNAVFLRGEIRVSVKCPALLVQAILCKAGAEGIGLDEKVRVGGKVEHCDFNPLRATLMS